MSHVILNKDLPVEQVKAVILLAFASDPMARWTYAEADQYLKHFPAVIEAMSGGAFAHGSAHFLEEGGAALWLPPGAEPDGQALEELFRRSVPQERFKDVMGIIEQMGNYHPSEPHWYLPMIGVEPAAQGRGLGSVLMKSMAEKLDDEGEIAYLESSNPRNISLYERHGFVRQGIIQAGQSPPLFPMVRLPR